MKKRKKSGSGRPEDTLTQPDFGGDVDLTGVDISQLSEAELEALTAPQYAVEEEFAVTPSEMTPDMSALAGAIGASAGLEEMESVEIPEPEMDELLAELLAQEPSMEMASDLPAETDLASMPEFPAEAVLEAAVVQSLDIPAPDAVAEAAAEPVVEAAPEPQFAPEPIVYAADEPLELIPEPEMPAALLADGLEEPMLVEPDSLEPEALEMEALPTPTVEAVHEPTPPPVHLFSEQLVPEVSEPVEEPAALSAAAALVEVEQPAEPAPPQPALETVVRSIDQALESAPPVASVAEPAAPVHHHKQFSQLDDYVVFTLAGTDYAVPVRDVAEIGRIPSITRLPNVPDFIRGITNLRGEVVPVLSLPVLLGLQDAPATARGRVLFLQPRERVSSTGLVVDEVKGIQRIQSQQLEQVTGLVDDKVTSVLRGVHGRGDRLLNVLDLEQLFHLQEFQQLESR
ncbi:MAG: chemotaxis protein CheW [Bryobacteraceae bacterium]